MHNFFFAPIWPTSNKFYSSFQTSMLGCSWGGNRKKNFLRVWNSLPKLFVSSVVPEFTSIWRRWFFLLHTHTHPHTHHIDVLSHYLIVPRHGIKTTWLTEHFTVYVWTAQKSPWQINESSFIPKSFRAFYLIGKTFWQVEF